MVKRKIEYDLNQALLKFTKYKVLEIVIILAFLLGFYYLGYWVNHHLEGKQCNLVSGIDIPCPHIENETLFGLWGLGVLFLMEIIFSLIIWIIIIGLVVILIYVFLRWNWEAAKKMAETPESKRLSAIEKERELRERWIILEGDIIKVKSYLKINEKYGNIKFVKRMKPFETLTARVMSLDEYDHTYKLKFNKEQKFWWTCGMLQLTKKRDNPFLRNL